MTRVAELERETENLKLRCAELERKAKNVDAVSQIPVSQRFLSLLLPNLKVRRGGRGITFPF